MRILSLLLLMVVAVASAQRETWIDVPIVSKERVATGGYRLREKLSVDKAKYPVLVEFLLKYEGDPLPSSGDLASFTKVDAEMASLQSIGGCVEVAIVTLNGKREWILYAKNGATLKKLLIGKFGKRQPEIHTRPDPGWTLYKQLNLAMHSA